MRISLKHSLPLASLLAAATGCSQRLAESPPAATTAARQVIVGVDRTDAFATLTGPALVIAAGIVERASWGDRVRVRWISDRSAAPDQEVLALDLPAEPPPTTNPFDARGKARRGQVLKTAQDQIKAALTELQGLCVGPTPSTDLRGFLLVAGQSFARGTAADEPRELVLITDLKDNQAHDLKPDLQGVTVVVHLFADGRHPETSERLKTEWKSRFLGWGAREVRFEVPQFDPKKVPVCNP